MAKIADRGPSGWLASEAGAFILPDLGPPSAFIAAVRRIVGDRQVIWNPKVVRRYCTGFRVGTGRALAVIKPRSLIELWHVLQTCVAHHKIVIMQAANTSLTGGSTPAGDDYDREVVIINTLSLAKLFVIEEGRQVICLSGGTLYQLEKALKPYGREPHSVIGSSCIGASVIGGICNNSGGALVRRGPAYTQMALFARLDEKGRLRLVNHLGVKLGDEPERILGRLERGEFGTTDVEHDPQRCGSDQDYARRVREIESDTPARFNADPQRLFEASGCAGKIIVFAVRLDTFPGDERTRVFYIGTRDPTELSALRRHILSRFESLPVAGEYLHRDMFNIAEEYGKDSFLTIQFLGTQRLPNFFRVKQAFDSLMSRPVLSWLGTSDWWFYQLSRVFPNHVPARLRAFRDPFEHHLILKMAGGGIEEAKGYLQSLFPSTTGDFFECTEEEARKAFLHRFVAAGAAMRYATIHERDVAGILALDIALRRNDHNWCEVLPDRVRNQLHFALYYGHFFCHVFHQDYVVRKGCDLEGLKRQLLELLDQRGAEYPAEHNVGHLYRAKPALADFYRSLDPRNQFNPGIGQTAKRGSWT